MIGTKRTDSAAKIGLRIVSCAAFGCLFGATLLASASPARAGEDDTSIETRIMRSVLEGIGLRKDGEAPINYEERAPLVIPPSRALPPPERSDAVIANNPAWPKDPDIARAKAEAAQEEKENNYETTAEKVRHDSGRLSPADMTPGQKPRAVRRTASAGSAQGTTSDYSEKMSPSQLGFKDSLFGMMFSKPKDENVAHFTSEPPRTALTDPPVGYQTPSPAQPYGAGKGAPPPKPTSGDYLVHHSEAEQ